jgi:hypothetical protein
MQEKKRVRLIRRYLNIIQISRTGRTVIFGMLCGGVSNAWRLGQ